MGALMSMSPMLKLMAKRHELELERVGVLAHDDADEVVVRTKPMYCAFVIGGWEFAHAVNASRAAAFDLLDEHMWRAARQLKQPSETWVLWSAFCNQWIVVACCMLFGDLRRSSEWMR